MGGIQCKPKYYYNPTKAVHKIYNFQSTRSEAYNMSSSRPIMPTSLAAMGDSLDVFLINSTIGYNHSQLGPAITVRNGASLHLHNSIIYGDTPYSIMLESDDINPPSSASIDYNLIKQGEQSILNHGNTGFYEYGENNLSNNPMWKNSGDYPFMLQAGSPCIDAGTDELPNGIELPETDLLGFNRRFNGTPDLGAYEWTGTSPGFGSPVRTKERPISAIPNPFQHNTTIKCDIEDYGELLMEVFSISGIKVKQITQVYIAPGTHSFTWDGNNEYGDKVPKGIYLIRTTIDNRIFSTIKIEKL